MSALQDVLAAYRVALGYLAPFTAIHLALRLLAAAVIVPLLGLVLAGVLATSGEAVLTDQDIARFLLTPGGFVGALVVTSLVIIASVLDVAVMTNTLRQHERNVILALAKGLSLTLARFTALFRFAVLLVLRILLIAAPFLLLAALIAWLALGRYDINYYLATKPPAFLAAAASIAGLLLLFSIALVWRLSSWAVSMHFLLFQRAAPRRAFALSAAQLQTDRLSVVGRILTWLFCWVLLAALVAAGAGLVIDWVQELLGANLRLIALATLALVLVWALANALLAALANGALAVLLDRLYRNATGHHPLAVQRPAEATNAGPLAQGPLLLIAALAIVAGGIYAGGELLEGIKAERQVEIIAHRGAAGARPENTMAAVLKALDERADWVEIDVQETADGEVVVAHDSDFMKLAGVKLKVWNATMADLAEIDIGSWFDPAYSSERTPTLREVLLAAKGRGKVLIELKYYGHAVALEQRVAQIVDETGMTDAVAVMSLKRPGIKKMQQLRPDLPQGVLAATAIGNLSALDVDFLALNTGQISLPLIRRAHAHGKKVYAWTVDDPVTMTRLISLGVDGLITNEPALARTVMEARNQLSTPERLLLWLSDHFQLDRFQLRPDVADA